MVHLCGIVLLFYLGLNPVQHDDLEVSLIGLRSQHAGADERRNFQLNFRKIDPMKDYADVFFTDQIDQISSILTTFCKTAKTMLLLLLLEINETCRLVLSEYFA